MIRERICGYVVVRKPDYATTEMLTPRLKIGHKVYRGLDRLPWEDFNHAYYDRRLPAAVQPVWQEFRRLNGDLSGIEILKSFGQAQDVLQLDEAKSGNHRDLVPRAREAQRS
ncbi:hypothetical protein ACQR1W_35500 [Bradyrhizobium sp. HKCCYLS1011]|uniref:hypothetical protein n=1 Tax=Bradyrhizobium sp. HKCCYLS1011 TaxID=3420733 RepID=UPI003EBF75DF